MDDCPRTAGAVCIVSADPQDPAAASKTAGAQRLTDAQHSALNFQAARRSLGQMDGGTTVAPSRRAVSLDIPHGDGTLGMRCSGGGGQVPPGVTPFQLHGRGSLDASTSSSASAYRTNREFWGDQGLPKPIRETIRESFWEVTDSGLPPAPVAAADGGDSALLFDDGRNAFEGLMNGGDDLVTASAMEMMGSELMAAVPGPTGAPPSAFLGASAAAGAAVGTASAPMDSDAPGGAPGELGAGASGREPFRVSEAGSAHSTPVKAAVAGLDGGATAASAGGLAAQAQFAAAHAAAQAAAHQHYVLQMYGMLGQNNGGTGATGGGAGSTPFSDPEAELRAMYVASGGAVAGSDPRSSDGASSIATGTDDGTSPHVSSNLGVGTGLSPAASGSSSARVGRRPSRAGSRLRITDDSIGVMGRLLEKRTRSATAVQDGSCSAVSSMQAQLLAAGLAGLETTPRCQSLTAAGLGVRPGVGPGADLLSRGLHAHIGSMGDASSLDGSLCSPGVGSPSGSSSFAGRKHVKWSEDEELALVAGVEACGVGQWAKIKKLDAAAHPYAAHLVGRSPGDLKDKWRNLMRWVNPGKPKRKGCKPPSPLIMQRVLRLTTGRGSCAAADASSPTGTDSVQEDAA